MLAFAIVRCIEILGEAATHVSPDTRRAHPQVPWTAITGMRNRIVHACFDVDRDMVRSTVVEDLPRSSGPRNGPSVPRRGREGPAVPAYSSARVSLRGW